MSIWILIIDDNRTYGALGSKTPGVMDNKIHEFGRFGHRTMNYSVYDKSCILSELSTHTLNLKYFNIV